MLVTRTNDTVRQTVTLYTMSNWAQPGRRTAVVIDGPTPSRRVTEPDRRAGLPGGPWQRPEPQRRSLPGELRIPVPGLPVPNGRLPAVIPLSPA